MLGLVLLLLQRDKLCVGIDNLMTEFEPTITANLYSVHFVPVAVQLNGSKRLVLLMVRPLVCQYINNHC